MVALLLAFAACTRAGPATADADSTTMDAEAARREIVAMMERSAVAWNRGDLDTFMADYRPGTRTTYIGRSGIVRGPDAIRGVYAPRFAPGGIRDSLSFEGTEVDLIAPATANVISWYVLSRGDSVVARGPTSLVMLREEGRWRIAHDHSS
jgi:uncharacterized protein (TIGR02246 family)